MDTILEFKKLAETLFENYPKHKQEVYIKYGLRDGDMPRTLEETGLLLKPPSAKQNVSQKIKTNAENFRFVILGEQSDKTPQVAIRTLKCPPELSDKIKELQAELLQRKISNKNDVNALLRTSYGSECTVDDSWVKFLLDLLLDLKERPSPYIENIIVLDKSIDAELVGNIRKYILDYLKKRVVPCSIEDIITSRGTKSQLKIDRGSVDLIRRLVPLMEEVEEIKSGESTLYQVRIGKLGTVEKAIRILHEADEPVLLAAEILDRIHYQLLQIGITDRIAIDNLKNQLSEDQRSNNPRVLNIGGTSQWRLKNENHDASTIKDLIIRVLTQSLEPLSVQEIVDRMPPERRIANVTVSATISNNREMFLKIRGNKYILKSWRNRFVGQLEQIRQRMLPEDMATAIISVFRKNENHDMLQAELHKQLIDICPNPVTFDSWLRRLSNVVDLRGKDGQRNVWYIKDDCEKYAKKKISLAEQIKRESIEIISANKNLISLGDLREKLVRREFNDRTVYSVINNNDDVFMKYEFQGTKMVKLINWEDNDPSQGQGEVVQKISEIQSAMGMLVAKVNGVDEKLGSFDERISKIHDALLGEFDQFRERTFVDPENPESLNQYADKVKNRISEMIVAENFPQINEMEDGSHFESVWKSVSIETREYLTVGEWMWKIFSSDGFDHAHICSTTCRAAELELHKVLLKLLKRVVPDATLKRAGREWTIQNVDYMTIGEYLNVLKYNRGVLIRPFNNSGVDLDSFVRILEEIQPIRNRVSHKDPVDKAAAQRLRGLVFANNAKNLFAQLKKLAKA